MSRFAGIVLAGGRSSRMGRPKAALDWYGPALVARVGGILLRTVDGPVVVVRAPGQELPPLPSGVEVTEDAREGQGPLEGIAAGLRAVGRRTEAAYVSSTDVPLLHPAFVARVAGGLDDDVDVVVPRVDGRMHPLAAVYRTSLLAVVERLLAEKRMRPAYLFDEVRVRWLDEAALLTDPALRTADPELDSLRNLNAPEDYAAARALPLPEVRVERYGTLRPPAGDGAELVRAATLGAAAAAVGVDLDGHVVAALNGDQISRDPDLPLAAGDVVALMSADAGG